MTPSALALAGPTAAGKTQLSLALAESLNGEIISADSGAVYRCMDIGAAKPPPAALARVPHHLINIRNPDSPFSAGEFCRLATKAVCEISARGKLPIFVGGTMMYFRVLTEGMHEFPPIPENVRQEVRRNMQQHGAAVMHKRLAAIDPTMAAQLDDGDSQRIGRALEVCYAADCPMSDLLAKPKTTAALPLSAILLIPQTRGRLRTAISARLQQMLNDGLVSETEEVIRRFSLSPDAPCLRLAGYRQAAEFLRGECTAAEMKKRAYFATCQLAKRQLTWLKKWQTPLATIDPFADDAQDRIFAAVKEWRH